MERLTKIVLTLWACAAVTWQVSLLSWSNLPIMAAGIALAACLLTRLDRRAIGALLVVAYLFPTIVRQLQGSPFPPFGVLWIAGLLGAILPDALRNPWRIPSRWRGALIFAAGVAVVGSAIVIWREIDGMWALATNPASMFWFGSTPPPFLVISVLHTALIAVIGVLWFDWLCGLAADDLERTVLTPLVVSAALMSAMSVYQMLFDIRAFNEMAFGTMRRASGTMYDANVAGILAALWTGGTLLWAARLRGWRIYVAPLLVATNAAAVWGSGSRTALITMIATTVIGVASVLWKGRATLSRRSWLGAAAAAAMVVLAVAVAAGSAVTANPAGRLWSSLPFASGKSMQDFGWELWTRNGYGSAGNAMIQAFPIAGVGVGSFHGFVTEYGARVGQWLPPDNAQSWLRHQIAELGFIGAAGWIVWVVAFGAFVLTPRKTELPGTWTARGLVATFGAVSLVAMHGQELMVVITFWALAAWYVGLVGAPPSLPLSRRVWAAMAVGLGVFAVATASAAAGDLRLTSRALRLKAPLSYGIAPPETTGLDSGFRRVRADAVVLVETSPRWMAIVVKRADADPDMLKVPAEVRVWCNGEAVLKATLAHASPIAAFVPVKQAERMVLETSARYTGGSWLRRWSARPELLVKWEFVKYPPTGFRGYQGVSPTSE